MAYGRYVLCYLQLQFLQPVKPFFLAQIALEPYCQSLTVEVACE
jgi:hypothetical protein